MILEYGKYYDTSSAQSLSERGTIIAYSFTVPKCLLMRRLYVGSFTLLL